MATARDERPVERNDAERPTLRRSGIGNAVETRELRATDACTGITAIEQRVVHVAISSCDVESLGQRVWHAGWRQWSIQAAP
jgi:hypothetical protein